MEYGGLRLSCQSNIFFLCFGVASAHLYKPSNRACLLSSMLIQERIDTNDTCGNA